MSTLLYSNDLRSEFNDNYRYAHDFWAPYIQNAQVYNYAASGSTWTERERKMLVDAGREPIEMNIMRRPLQFYSGYLRDNINSIVIAPVEGSDQKTADQLTKLSSYVWDKGKGYSTFLDSADECMKAGISLCGIRIDYRKDFINGDICFFKRTYNSFYLDPTFESIDLSDCQFGITRDLISRTSIKDLIPFVDPKIIDDIQMSFRDDKFLSYHPNFTNLSRFRDLIAYDQYYRKVTKKRKFLVDEKSSFFRDVTDLSSEEMKKLKIGIGRMKKMYEDADDLGLDRNDMSVVDIRDADREFVELNIMLNGEPVYTGEDKTGIVDTYPFVPLICYMEPSIFTPGQRLQGIPATIYSTQRQFNKRHMKIVDVFDSSISTGYKYFIGSVADPEDLQQSGQNKLIGIDPDNAPAGMDSVQELRGGNGINPELMQYQAELDRISLVLANVNESVLGIDEGGNTQVSGKLAQVRVAQGLRANRKLFDNIELSQEILGGLVVKAIQNHMPPGKVERILAEKPTEQFYEQQFEQYDAVIKQGVLSKSQKDAYYYELVQLKKDGIVDIPQSAIVKALQMAGLSDLEQEFEKQDAEQAAQKKKIDELEALQLEGMNAKKEQDLALAQERRARVVADLALAKERISEATENRAQAALARSKTITEIAQMKDERILRVLEFVNQLEREESDKQEGITGQIFNASDQINSETQGSAENQQKTQVEQALSQLQGGQNGQL